MSYNLFTSNKVFANELVNTYCNKLFHNCRFHQIPLEKVLIGGSVAKILQGEEIATIKDIDIIVLETEIFEILHKTLSEEFKIPTSKITGKGKKRFYLKTPEVVFEFWLVEKDTTIFEYNGILCEHLSEINKYK